MAKRLKLGYPHTFRYFMIVNFELVGCDSPGDCLADEFVADEFVADEFVDLLSIWSVLLSGRYFYQITIWIFKQ
ncbi:hypothetical protein [Leptolyngbya sp. 'hensonii']|uniref:hypothetical protein n=1 Tax=Leptolyngbya sp. 'hensonii' TaxID=1922337 RepID=UPI001180B87C|nr:hypothetical protein [Leptolyngbya sp. 'hensonii']